MIFKLETLHLFACINIESLLSSILSSITDLGQIYILMVLIVLNYDGECSQSNLDYDFFSIIVFELKTLGIPHIL